MICKEKSNRKSIYIYNSELLVSWPRVCYHLKASLSHDLKNGLEAIAPWGLGRWEE